MPVRKIYFTLLSVGLVACANPVASMKSDIQVFRNDYPQNFSFTTSNNKKVHFAWSGDRTKTPLLFVHGSPGSWEGWASFLLNKELQKNFYIIAVDRLGYGRSEKGQSEGSLEKQAQAVLSTLPDTSPKAILIGHSYGGPVVARAAMMAPEKISKVIFVASSVSPDLEETKWFQYPASWWPIKHLIPTDLRVCNEEIMALKMELINQMSFWPKINSRIAIIHGIDDQLVPLANVDFLIRHLSKESIVFLDKIPHQGHFIPWDRPDSILSAIFK